MVERAGSGARLRLAGLTALLLLAACEQASRAPASVPADAAADSAAGAAIDAATLADAARCGAGDCDDSGKPGSHDASTPQDAARSEDAASSMDATAELDSATEDDGGAEASDAGQVDAGDAGHPGPLVLPDVDAAHWTLFAPTEGAYSRPLGLVALVSTDEPTLLLFDTSTRSFSRIPLRLPGNAIALDPSGRRAAVGHAGAVTIVDLESQTAVTELDTSANVFDLAFACNGIVYVTHAVGTEGRIWELEIATNTERSQPGRYGRHHLALHPGEPTLYALSTEFTRFDISSGSAILDLGPYRNDHPTVGNLVISGDGTYALTGYGIVSHLSSDPSKELAYRGQLQALHGPEQLGVVHTDISPSSALIASLPSFAFGPVSQRMRVHVHDAAFLTPRNLIITPSMLLGGVPQATLPRFVFFGADEETLHIALVATAGGPPESFVHVVSLPLPAPNALAPSDEFALAVNAPGAVALGLRMIDAEYDDVSERIVLVSAEPSELQILDPRDPTARESVALPLAPRAVSLAPDRTTAAVAHDGWISIVDLAQMEVSEVFPLPHVFFDVVLAGNGYAYGFPARGDLTEIYALDLSSGAVSTVGEISELTRAYLHPDGDRIYGTDRSDRYHDLQRFDLTNPALPAISASQHVTETSMCNDLWLSETAAWAFTACGHVYALAGGPTEDRTYVATFGPDYPSPGTYVTFLALDHSAAAGRVATAAAWPPTGRNVEFYDDVYFEREATAALPQVEVNGTAVELEPRSLFFANAGDELYLLADAEDASLARPTALVTFANPAANVVPAAHDAAMATAYSGFVPFAGVPVEAAYSDAANLFAMATAVPPALITHVPGSGTFRYTDLPKAARQLAIDPAGSQAVVSHDGFVSVVDLATGDLVDTFAAGAALGDLALAADGFAYATGPSSRPPSLHALDTATGSATHHYAVSRTNYLYRIAVLSDGTRGYGHPGGSLPAPLTRFDILDHVPQTLDPDLTPASVPHPVHDGVWFTDGEARLVTGAASVWQIAADAAADRVYLGRFETVLSIAHMDHAAGVGLYAAISARRYSGEPPATEVHLIDDASFMTSDIVELPPFMISGVQVAPRARWVGLAETQGMLHVVVQASPAASYGEEFAVVSVPMP